MIRWIRIVTWLAPVFAGAASNTCAPMTEARKAALCRYVQRKYHLPEDSPPTISEMSNVSGSCYRKLRFVAPGKRKFGITPYLTPDRRFLVSELNDLAVDPVAEEKRMQVEARRNLEKDDGRASLGASNAPVTVVVFSDFECPYCKKFAETLRQVAVDEKKVRFLFRNLPLEMHPWAKPAAEIAACVDMQNPEAFWLVHDYLFEHQRELRAENLNQQVMGFVGSLRGVRVSQVHECAEKHLAMPRIQRDLALASASKVSGTPSVFVNGQPANGGALTREYLLTLVRENLREVASTNAARPSP